MSKPPRRERRPTAADVARLAGVSASTVSLVLQNKGGIPEDTRARVHAAVARTGYTKRPHRRAAAKSHAIGVVVEDIENPYFAELHSGIDAASADRDRLTLLLSSRGSVARQVRRLRDLKDLGCDGAILVPVDGSGKETLEAIEALDMPVIFGIRHLDSGTYDFVGPDHFLGMRLATRHLLELGHRNIAFAGGQPNNTAYSARLGGFRMTVDERSGEDISTIELGGPITGGFGIEAMERLLETTRPPTAVLAYNDQVAFGLMSAARERGFVPGKDIAIVGFDDVKAAALRTIPLTTVSTPPFRLGEEMTRLLEARIGRSDAAPVNVILPPVLKVRRSCCPPADRSLPA